MRGCSFEATDAPEGTSRTTEPGGLTTLRHAPASQLDDEDSFRGFRAVAPLKPPAPEVIRGLDASKVGTTCCNASRVCERRPAPLIRICPDVSKVSKTRLATLIQGRPEEVYTSVRACRDASRVGARGPVPPIRTRRDVSRVRKLRAGSWPERRSVPLIKPCRDASKVGTRRPVGDPGTGEQQPQHRWWSAFEATLAPSLTCTRVCASTR